MGLAIRQDGDSTGEILFLLKGKERPPWPNLLEKDFCI